ncbi:MalY/PatB family protein [Pseudodesulfovibrio sp. zrk46]|uniref:MalY/PatB family protein n=1 Tax=Pseudodesulfovibrio sp. zrk46 TaxID=2725288 RepID=UPI001449581B|nr:MalY/PatB family protein [Pseudodesulfovibrio sp. zrk46]QJB56656.1 pyridoxal phosphate-dependent aminotransferase [Pseudodesulfovibrio sp. zrk46]
MMSHAEQYDFDTLVSRENTHSVKWDFIPADKDDLLPLWIADMDFVCAQPIIDAMRARVDRRIFGYSMPFTDEYLEAVTGWFRRRANWNIERESIVVAPGIVPALGVLIRALTSEGDGIIIQNPVYYPFSKMIANNGRRLVNNPLINNEGVYTMDFEDLEAKARDPKVTMMLLCNPHNPVGRVWTPEELSTVADICLRNNVLLISDDIHCDLIREDAVYTPVSSLNPSERIITCTSASKTFNLAGLHLSNIVIPDEGMRKLWEAEALGRCGLFGGNAFGIVATQAAYTHGEVWLEQVNRYIADNLRYIGEFVADRLPKARYWYPEGTYFAWIDFREYGYSSEQLEDLMLNRARVALDEGYIFGEEGCGFERINVACPRSILEDCMERMAEALG